MPAFRGDVGGQGRQDRRDRQAERRRQRASSMPQGRVVAPGFIDNHCHYDAQVTWDPLCSFSCDHGATTVIFGNCSLSLAPVRPGQVGAAGRVPVLCRSDPDGGAAHRRVQLGDVAAIHRPARPQSRRQCRQSDRPHRGALLRDGRRVPEAHRDRRRDQGDAGRRARRHAAPARSGSRCRATRAITTRRASTSRRCGPTRRRSSRSATCCANSAPASSRAAAATAPR